MSPEVDIVTFEVDDDRNGIRGKRAADRTHAIASIDRLIGVLAAIVDVVSSEIDDECGTAAVVRRAGPTDDDGSLVSPADFDNVAPGDRFRADALGIPVASRCGTVLLAEVRRDGERRVDGLGDDGTGGGDTLVVDSSCDDEQSVTQLLRLIRLLLADVDRFLRVELLFLEKDRRMFEKECAFLDRESGERVRDLLACSCECGEENAERVRPLGPDARTLLRPDDEVQLLGRRDDELGDAEGRCDVLCEPANVRFGVERAIEQAVGHRQPERVRHVGVVGSEVQIVARQRDR